MVGLQILYPQGHENVVIKATALGAIINFSLNYVLIPIVSQFGAAVATCLAELSVTVFMLFLGKAYIPFSVLNKKQITILLASIVVCCPILYLRTLGLPSVLLIVIGITISIVLYSLFLIASNNEVIHIAASCLKFKYRH